jgi:hypothetical protein
LLLGVLADGTPARAQGYGPDGLSICAFTNSGGKAVRAVIGPCRPLNDQTMRSFDLSASQTAIVATLPSLVANPVVELPPRAANTSLAAARPFADVGALSDYWFPDPADPGNVAVGLHPLYMKEDESPRLTQMTYAVDGVEGHFTVLWNRALMSPRR